MNLLRCLFGERRGVKTSKPTRSRTLLEVEGLEDRNLMSSSGLAALPAPVQTAGPAADADGKVHVTDISITKTTDSSSPLFFKNCCAGQHYNNVTIEMRKAGGDPSSAGKEFLQFKFDTVFTTKIDWSGPGDEGPQESITFNYGKISVDYSQQ